MMDTNRDRPPELQFLHAIYGLCSDTDGEVIIVESKNRLLGTYSISELDDIKLGGHDTYFKVNLFDADAMQKRSPYAIGSKSELKTVVALHLDIDVGKSKYASQAEVRQHIGELTPPPSAIILSDGPDGGFHLYWFLSRPYPVDGNADTWSARIKGLRQQLPTGAADSAPAATGLLRLPGSTRQSGNRVTVEELHENRRYPVNAFPPLGKPRVLVTRSALPDVYYPTTPRENSIIATHLDAAGMSLTAVLRQHKWKRYENGEWIHADSKTDSRSAIEYFCEGRPGITVYSTALSPIFEQYRWYGREACHVQLNFSGDWNAAAAEAHRYVERAGIPVEPYVARPIDSVTVEEFRNSLTNVVMNHRNAPGTLALVRAPTGMGKSYMTRQRIVKEPSARLVTNVHSNCKEEEEQMVDAVAYPSVELCENKQRDKVLASGLTLGAVLCPRCQLADGCHYLSTSNKAADARIQISTHHRANVSEYARGLRNEKPVASFVAIHEESLPPQLVFTRDDIVVLRDRFEQHLCLISEGPKRSALNSLICLCARMLRIEESTEETTTYPVSAQQRTTAWFWEPLVWSIVEHTVVSGAATRSILDIHLGKAKKWSVVIQRTRNGEAYKEFVADWQPKLSPKTVFFDATGDAGILSMAWGVPVQDITPTDTLSHRKCVRQLKGDVKQTTTPRKAAGYVRALLFGDRSIQRLGLITHRCILERLELEPQLSHRIARSSYFGNGSERASNAWMEECDAILVLGTWRPPQDHVRRMLVLLGKEESSRLDPDWVPRKWEANCGDIVETKRYDDPEWHQVHQYLVQAELMQCIGRARPFIDDGIRCFVVSSEPLDLPYENETQPILFAAEELKFNAKLATLFHRHLKTTDLLSMMPEVPERTANRYISKSPYLSRVRNGVYVTVFGTP